jgi:hypothetical protein
VQPRHYATRRSGSSTPLNQTSRKLRERPRYSAWHCKRGDSVPICPQPSRLTETGPTKNAPSRCRLRPAIRLTFAEATATRRAINLGRSVLGASSTLWALSTRVKAVWDALARNLRSFLFTQFKLRMQVHALVALKKEKGRARGPGRKNSPSRERFRPPSRQTVRFRVVLLGGLRPTGAPCSAQRHSMRIRTRPARARSKETRANCEVASCERKRSGREAPRL